MPTIRPFFSPETLRSLAPARLQALVEPFRDSLFEPRGPLVVENVDEEAPGVQIDAAVVLMLSPVNAHRMASLATGRPDPASWLPRFGSG